MQLGPESFCWYGSSCLMSTSYPALHPNDRSRILLGGGGASKESYFSMGMKTQALTSAYKNNKWNKVMTYVPEGGGYLLHPPPPPPPPPLTNDLFDIGNFNKNILCLSMTLILSLWSISSFVIHAFRYDFLYFYMYMLDSVR